MRETKTLNFIYFPWSLKKLHFCSFTYLMLFLYLKVDLATLEALNSDP